METVEIKHFTVTDVRNWLEHNQAPDGLTNEVIRPAFAWALVHHPHVKDEDPILSVIYEVGVLAASTCAYPEILEKPNFADESGNQKRIWWFPMLWVKPEYRGKAYGLVAIGSLAEIYGEDCAWTAWAVPESIEIFEYLGCKTVYLPRYFFDSKQIRTGGLMGKLASWKQCLIKKLRSSSMPRMPHYDFALRYLNVVDDESYSFIRQHREKNFLQSSQEVLNWEMQYPWSVSMPLSERVSKDADYFADVMPLLQHSFVQVRINDKLVGVYRLRITQCGITCDNIFYDNQEADMVFASIVEHIQKLKVRHFDTEDPALAMFVRKYVYFPKYTEEQISLSIAPSIETPKQLLR